MLFEPTPDYIQHAKVLASGIGAWIIACIVFMSSTGCTTAFGAVGGSDIQRLYNDRLRIEYNRQDDENRGRR